LWRRCLSRARLLPLSARAGAVRRRSHCQKGTSKAYDRHVANAKNYADDEPNAAGDRGARDESGDGTDNEMGVDGARPNNDSNGGTDDRGVGGTKGDKRRGGGRPSSFMKMSLAHLSHTFTPQK